MAEAAATGQASSEAPTGMGGWGVAEQSPTPTTITHTPYPTRRKLRHDLTGRQFKYLTVLGRAKPRTYSERNRTAWLCLCECGNEATFTGQSLLRGDAVSCGCKRFKTPLSLYSQFYRDCKRNALKRSKPFDLSQREWFSYVFKPCHYCGCAPQLKSIGHNRWLAANGLDCVDPSLGYVAGNIVTSCGQCNYMKLDYTVEEFKDKALSIVLNDTHLVDQVLREAVRKGVLSLRREDLAVEGRFAKSG